MKRLFIFGAIAFVVAACSKDKFKTIPQVKIKEFGPAEVRKGDLVRLVATVTDQEGDVQDSLYVVEKRYNGSNLLNVDTVKRSLARMGAPKKQEIEIEVTYLYGELTPEIAPPLRLETFADRNFTLGIIVIDKAHNRSEYVESDTIVLKKFP